MEGIDCQVFSESVLMGMWNTSDIDQCILMLLLLNLQKLCQHRLVSSLYPGLSRPEYTAPLFHYHSNVYFCHTGTRELKTRVPFNVWCLIANKEEELVISQKEEEEQF